MHRVYGTRGLGIGVLHRISIAVDCRRVSNEDRGSSDAGSLAAGGDFHDVDAVMVEHVNAPPGRRLRFGAAARSRLVVGVRVPVDSIEGVSAEVQQTGLGGADGGQQVTCTKREDGVRLYIALSFRKGRRKDGVQGQKSVSPPPITSAHFATRG